jgi:hypothetical protein
MCCLYCLLSLSLYLSIYLSLSLNALRVHPRGVEDAGGEHGRGGAPGRGSPETEDETRRHGMRC